MPEKSVPYLSVVIPVFNEESRISLALEDVLNYLSVRPEPWEVLVVDDGSLDRTGEVVRGFIEKRRQIRWIRLPVNQGKGEAIRKGMLEAKGRYRLFRDADRSTRMGEFDRFRPFLEHGAPVVIGSRRISGAETVRHQPVLREMLGRGFTWLCRILLAWEVLDYTCGFKCFSARAAEEIFSRQRIRRWAFDAEILFLARRLGYPIVQVPVVWNDSPGTKVRLWKDVAGSFWEILRVRVNAWRGVYGLLGRPGAAG